MRRVKERATEHIAVTKSTKRRVDRLARERWTTKAKIVEDAVTAYEEKEAERAR